MEGDRSNNSSEGTNDGRQKGRSSNGRTSGPTRRSSKGQWTYEEDEILRQAVHRFNGKNWKKIAECFKDRTDVQCLHRWQKVLNPELVKGPWSREEDEVIVQLVEQYGPTKWSTIAQHLPGRIGKQCRERWHNHLNPAINRDVWSQEEELILCRAHQVYGNKWAELTKYLPGRTDNAIKNHWNSSVKKKLDSYKVAGLLAKYEALPLESFLNRPMPSSSSRTQQVSGDENIPRDGPEAEENSEYSQPTSDMANNAAVRDDFQLTESSAVTSSNNLHTNYQEISYSMPEMHYEFGSSSNFIDNNFSPDWVTTSQGENGELDSNDLRNLPSLDLEQENSRLLLHSISGNENHEGFPFPLSTSAAASSSTPMTDMIMTYDKPENLLTFQDGYPETGNEGTYPSGSLTNYSNIPNAGGPTDSLVYEEHGQITETGNIGPYPSGNLTNYSNIANAGGPTETLLYQAHNQITETENKSPYPSGSLINYSNIANVGGPKDPLVYQAPGQITDAAAAPLASCSYYSFNPEVWQPFPINSQLSDAEGAIIYGSDPNQFNDLLIGIEEDELLTRTNDGFMYTVDPVDSRFDKGTDNLGQQRQQQTKRERDVSKLVLADANAFGPGESSNNGQNCPSLEENPVDPAENKDSGNLFYEPPRFPSLDIPFFSCDLIQPGPDTQEFSPLGIRQILTSTMNCFTPCRLWGSPLRDDSPDAVLKSAAKSFNGTPSILKKRHRDLVSPLSEKRCEKKLESGPGQMSFSNLARDFSRLEVMFNENGNLEIPVTSPPANLKRSSGESDEDKENVSDGNEMGKNEGRDCIPFSESRKLDKELDSCNLQDKTNQETISMDAKNKGEADAATQTMERPSGVLVEQKLNDTLFFSPDRFGNTPNRVLDSSDRTLESRYTRRLEAASIEDNVSESSLSHNPCSSGLSPSTACIKKGTSTSIRTDPLSTPLEINIPDSGKTDWPENLNIFGGTPFKRSIESPSAWKSPWFINSFVVGPQVDRELTIEDMGYFMSPGDRSYDAIGLMKHISEQTASAFAEAQEVLGDETPDSILKKQCSNDAKEDPTSSVMAERRVLDFSECETPGKGKESGRASTGMSFSSPSSYLLKGCR